MLTITSPAFEPGRPIPRQYTGEGRDVSPPLEWSGVPGDARELALICDDPDAPRPEPWVHWILYGIPAERTSLPEGGSGGARQGRNSWGRTGYGGPMPPPGHGVHHYHFRLYALDEPLKIGTHIDKAGLLTAIEGHILAEGELVGTYSR